VEHITKICLAGTFLCLSSLIITPVHTAVHVESLQTSTQKQCDSITIANERANLFYVRHPILFLIVTAHLLVKTNFVDFLLKISREKEYHNDVFYTIKRPFLFLLAVILAIRIVVRSKIWVTFSDILYWGWRETSYWPWPTRF